MTSSMRARLLTITSLVGFLCVPIHAQVTGTILGSVQDESGAQWWLMRRESGWFIVGAF